VVLRTGANVGHPDRFQIDAALREWLTKRGALKKAGTKGRKGVAMGELRQRGRIWWVRYYRNGRRHEESSRSDKREDANRLLKLREGDVAKGLPISPKIGRLRFDDAADLVTDYKVNTRRAREHVERSIAKGLKPYFGGWRMANITTADIRKYIDHRQEAGAANATINRELAALKRMFSLAIQAGKLTKSEILPLTWAQVDRAEGIVRLEPDTTKNREGRQFPCADLPELKAVIDAQWAAHEALKKAGTICPYVLQRSGKKKQGQQVKNFRRAWLTATKAAGCPGRIPHDFRRTAVRNLVRAGVPEKTAMTITGHKTRSVFDRYDIVSEQDQREAVRKLAGTISGTIGGSTENPSANPQKQTA
jgi:integrase